MATLHFATPLGTRQNRLGSESSTNRRPLRLGGGVVKCNVALAFRAVMRVWAGNGGAFCGAKLAMPSRTRFYMDMFLVFVAEGLTSAQQRGNGRVTTLLSWA